MHSRSPTRAGKMKNALLAASGSRQEEEEEKEKEEGLFRANAGDAMPT